MNPSRELITGVVCGVRVEEIEDPLIQEIRYLDKLINELAKTSRWKRFCVGRRDGLAPVYWWLPGTLTASPPRGKSGSRSRLVTTPSGPLCGVSQIDPPGIDD
ncbi:MAG: DUF2200 family protein [Solirubrobacterales bacterium]|nr:DUF2200 family protein [Solirubrobacterales bacterium]